MNEIPTDAAVLSYVLTEILNNAAILSSDIKEMFTSAAVLSNVVSEISIIGRPILHKNGRPLRTAFSVDVLLTRLFLHV